MTKELLTIEIALLQDGSIDIIETRNRFNVALDKRINDIENEAIRIANVIDKVFDENKGQTIPLKTLACIACDKLNTPIEIYTIMSKRIINYIHKHAKGKKFIITPGKKGGVKRANNI
jgi:hypothetical protein